MVSAVFHGPFDPALSGAKLPDRAIKSVATTSTNTATTEQNAVKTEPASAPMVASSIGAPRKAAQPRFDGQAWLLRVLPPLCGLGLLIGIWALVSLRGGFPSPIETFWQAVDVFSKPFYRNGPNDQGIGWNVLQSLQRVALGFGLAAAVGIPLGFIIGRFTFANRMFGPIISLLKPVSPLAWLPIGLLVFKGANPAAIWTIFICSIWPMVVNTAVGVQRVPQDYLNVARVLNLSEWKVITKILFPAVLPYMLTGVRLAVGTAWLVIVAAEMLTGGVGIGFWVWDEWNNLNVKNIIIAIVIIGVVGLVLEMLLIKLASAFTYEEVKN
jgi:nitrate/nitrite transport system permease protein